MTGKPGRFASATFAALIGALVPAASVFADVNELAVGPLAKVNDAIRLESSPMREFDSMTRADIEAMRIAIINQHSNLLTHAYTPCDQVFGLVEDRKPWWGAKGDCIWGPGERSIDGDSEESRFVLNPFILVGVNSYTSNIWDPDKVTEEDLARTDLPFYWMPSSVRWWPAQRMGEVRYDVTDFMKRLNQYRPKLKGDALAAEFALVAYNARDFGYNWLWISKEMSRNIEWTANPREPVRLEQFIHCGITCAYPGGCNNMSPHTALDSVKFSKLPALAYVELWKQKPRTTGDAPDMIFIIALD